jgi:ubiquinone biosynthesis protein
MLLAPKYIPRLAATVGLFARFGLRDFARTQGLHAFAPEEFGDDDGVANNGTKERALAFTKRLVELGPAYVKLGQVLSTRPDLVPDAYIEALAKLHNEVEPISFDDIEATIQTELHARISKLFNSFEETPLGSASLGQVHAAELRDGRKVVVKVQRPRIREVLADDIEYFNELARFMTSHTQVGNRVDMLGVIQQLERALADELDYRIEARNGATLRRSLAEFPRILIPRVVEGYSTEKILTTERIMGIKIDEIPPVTRLESDFHPVADEVAKAYLKQITIDGHFHADPHPGNLFVVLPEHENPRTPAEVRASERRFELRPALTALTKLEQQAQKDAPALPEGPDIKVALIDFGMTARLSDSMKDSVVRLLIDISDNRGDDAAQVMIEMGDPAEDFDRTGYQREIAQLVARNYDLTIGEVQAGTVLYEVINISYRSGLKLPAELTLLAKALFNLDAVTRALDPSYSPITAIREYTNRIANERAKRDLSPRRLFQLASETSSFMTQLPHRLDIITQKLAANELGMRVDAPQLSELLSGLQKIANRIFSGLVLTGLLIASAMLLPHRRSLGTAGFIIAAAVGVYMVASILMTDRRGHGKK